MSSEIHLFVIWKKGLPYTDYILQFINSKAEVLEVKKFICNRKQAVTIQRKLYRLSTKEAKKRCKNENFEQFIIIVVRIVHAKYIWVRAHWGPALVENTMYNTKQFLREVLNISFAIHGTIDKKEAEHDIPILTGNAITYYLESCPLNKIIQEGSL